MNEYPVVNSTQGTCYLCVGKSSGVKEVFVLKDGTEICPNHLKAVAKNGKKEQTRPALLNATA